MGKPVGVFEESGHTDEVIILNQHHISPYSLSVFFSLHLLCSLFNIFSGLSLSVFVLSPLFPFFVSIISSFAFFCLPLSLHFLLSPFISYGISFSLCACICLSLAGFLVYHSSQEAVVWDIPVSTVIGYGLSSFIGALLSCKITQGSFCLSGNQFIGDIYSGMTFSGFVFQRQTVLLLLAG